jgi:hypothetical protein
MKRSLLVLLAFTAAFNLFSQDMIVKKDGEEIKSKIIEIGIDNVKFKKFDNLEGPDYVLPKYEIVFVKFQNGTKEVFSVEKPIETSQEIRKGPHMGIHFAPGIGKLSGQSSKMGFSYNLGMDLNIYFNDYVGLKTGFNYQKISLEYDTENLYFGSGLPSYYAYSISGKVNSFGIPLKLVVTSGKKVGVYFEMGVAVYFILSANTESIYSYGEQQPDNVQFTTLSTEPVYLAQEAVFGLNIMASKNVSFNLGISNHIGLTKVLKNSSNSEGGRAIGFGLQFGLMFNLAN